jgi:magnesium chelatase family protein
MLARRLTTILPAMTLAEAIETTRIHSVAGLTGDRTTVVTTCPCRPLHRAMADVSAIGGDQVPRPSEWGTPEAAKSERAWLTPGMPQLATWV